MLRRVALMGLAVIIGAGLGLAAVFAYGPPARTAEVAVVDGPPGLIGAPLTDAVRAKLELLAQDPDVKAVVIRVDSPGGSITASESLYAAVAELRRHKPVVVSVDGTATSGAYLMSLGANEIFASSSSIVGNVGAILVTDRDPAPTEQFRGSGPFKLAGGSEQMFLGLLDQAKESFYRLVEAERGERLDAPREEILLGRIYSGIDALRLGLIDELGGQSEAAARAAELAGLRDYEVVPAAGMLERAGGRYAEALATVEAARPEGDFDFDVSGSQFPYLHYLYVPERD